MADLKVSVSSSPPMDIRLQTPMAQSISLTGAAQVITKNYNVLINKPQVNGITLEGDQTSAGLHIVSETTKAGWEEVE